MLNDRLRSEGTANLVAAAKAAGAERIIAQSIAFAYAPGPPGTVHVERDALLSPSGPEGIPPLGAGGGGARAGRRSAPAAWCCATATSTDPAARSRGTARSAPTSPGGACRSSAAAPACGRSSTSTTRPARRWRPSLQGGRRPTTSSTTSLRASREWMPALAGRSERPGRGASRLRRPAARRRLRRAVMTRAQGASNGPPAPSWTGARVPELARGLRTLPLDLRRTTSTTPATSSTRPSTRWALTCCLATPSRPKRSIATEIASCPVITTAVRPLAPSVRTATSATET